MVETDTGPRPSDKWIPWYIVGFFIALVSVLVPMCIIAVRTHTGVVTDGAYEKGLAYNKNIAAEEQQESLKWHGDVSITPLPEGKIQAEFTLLGSNNKAIDDAEVKLWLVRPTQAGQDQNVAMTKQGNGHYVVVTHMPNNGQWEARVSATYNNQNYQITKRFVVP